MPDPMSPKRYRTYRGGRPGNDPENARFRFDGRDAAVQDRPATPPGLRRPGARPAPPRRPLPGRPVATAGEPPRRGRFHVGWKRGILIAVVVVLAALAAWVFYGYRAFANEVEKANHRLDRRTRAALTPPAGNILTTPQTSLILGSDSRGKGTVARSDSILLVRTDPGKHAISMLSIPRDLRVAIPGHGQDKINAAFAIGGAPLLIRTVRSLTGVPVNHIVLVDFTGFRDLVDALGGVNICSHRKIVSSQPFDGHNWRFPRGCHTLGGKRALAYARIRHTTDPADSDITRTERQQQVLQAIAHQLVSPTNIFRLPSVGAAVAKPLATDLSANQILGLGWIKFRAHRTVRCHLGGTPAVIGTQDVLLGSEQNRSVVEMFLGTQAPQPPPKGQIFAPGCTS